MMKLPTRPKTQIRKNENGRYDVIFLFYMENKAEFDNLISAALRENDILIDSNWETRTVTLSTNDIKAFDKRINLYRIMGIPDKA